MKRYVGTASSLLLLVLAAAAPAQINIPLLVEEHNNLARTGEILSSGVPFALGTLHDVDLANLRVEDASGAAVPAQFHVLSRWWSPRYDNSIRWLLVTFPATAGANVTTTYTLKTGSNVAPANPVSVTTTADLTTVDTGAIKAVINSASFKLFENVWLDR